MFNKLYKQKKCVILRNRRYLIIRCLLFDVTRSKKKKNKRLLTFVILIILL